MTNLSHIETENSEISSNLQQVNVYTPKMPGQIIKKDASGRFFQKGSVANPKGRPKTKHYDTRTLLGFLKSKKLELVKIAVSEALSGNTPVLLKLLDKILPSLTETSITFEDWLKNTQKQIQELDQQNKTGTYGI